MVRLGCFQQRVAPLIWVLSVAPPSFAIPLHFHVSVAHGSDTNPGTYAQPFQTLVQAQVAVRTALARTGRSAVTVFVHPGTYYLEAPLRFGAEDGGSEGYSVTYRNFGEMPVLIGGRLLTNWTAVGKGVYRAQLDRMRCNALLEDEVAGVLARTPNRGYLRVAAVDGTADKPEFSYRRGDLPDLFNWRGAQVLVWAGYDEVWDGGKNYNWESTLVPIEAADFSSRTLKLAHRTIRQLHRHNRFYVRGAREFLDAPGEFWVDHAQGWFYYRPRNLPIENRRIVVATVTRLLEVIGTTNRPVRNLIFEGLQLCLSNTPDPFPPGVYLASDGLVYLEHTRKTQVRNCRISHSGLAAIALEGLNLENVVAGNLIEHCASSGIISRGYRISTAPYENPADAYVNRAHVFTNNYIRKCGRLIRHAAGIILNQSGDNLIAHNRIEDMPRYGIRFEGPSFGTMMRDRARGGLGGELFGIPITWSNHLDFVYTRNNRVTGNEIARCMQDSQDGGAICTYGIGSGNQFTRNLVKDMKSSVKEGSIVGVYLDDASNGSVVAENIVTRMRENRYVFPFLIKGCDNVVTNNITVRNQASAALYIMQTPGGGLPASEGFPEEPTMNIYLARNIFSLNRTREVYRSFPWHAGMLSRSDRNLFDVGGCDPEFRLGPKTFAWDEWRKELNHDLHSVSGDPLFRAPARGNFQFRPGSPALGLGFKPIDLREIGLRPDFRFR